MSVPFGGSQPAVPQPHSPDNADAGPNLGFILALVAAGLSLVIYLLSFSDDVFATVALGGLALPLPLLLGGGLLAGANALPKRPNTLLPATLLAALGALLMLLIVVKDSDAGGMSVVILIAGLLELAACAVALLMDHGVIKIAPKPRGYAAPAGGWSPQSGTFPQQGYGATPGYGQQQAGQYGGQPGQYGGAPAGGSQPQYGQGGGSGGHGGGHSGQPGQSGGPQQPDPRPGGSYGQQPYGQQPYGGGGQGQPGTPPGGFGVG